MISSSLEADCLLQSEQHLSCREQLDAPGWLIALRQDHARILQRGTAASGGFFRCSRFDRRSVVKQCHKPSMTGNGNHTTYIPPIYKNGDFPGGWWVYGIVLTTLL